MIGSPSVVFTALSNASAFTGMVYDWDVPTGEVFRTEGLYGLVGVRPEDVPDDPSWWAERVHPAVVEAMREVGIDLSKNRPAALVLKEILDVHYLVTMGCGRICP